MESWPLDRPAWWQLILTFAVSWVLCMRSPRPEVVFWVVAAAFVARSFFEAVMVCYYIWPALAVGLVLAARSSWTRFVAVCAISSFATVFALSSWRSEWGWWSVLIVCVGTILFVTRPRLGVRSGTVTDSATDPRRTRTRRN